PEPELTQSQKCPNQRLQPRSQRRPSVKKAAPQSAASGVSNKTNASGNRLKAPMLTAVSEAALPASRRFLLPPQVLPAAEAAACPSRDMSTLQPVRPSSGHSKTSSSGGGGSIGGMTEEIEVVLEELNKKYECPVCSQVLRYPVQFDEWWRPAVPRTRCHRQGQACTRDKPFQVETDNLGVKCSFYAARGCKLDRRAQGAHAAPVLRPHAHGLPHAPAEPNSRNASSRSIRDEDCPKRQFCELSMLAEDESEHLDACPKFPVPCPNKVAARREVTRERHCRSIWIADCLQQSQPCPFANYGCAHTWSAWPPSSPKKLAALNARIACLEKLYGPQLVWRIDSYQERLAEAKSGQEDYSLFSPPFLTHRTAYKLILSTCLYRRCPPLSPLNIIMYVLAAASTCRVFLSICKSENDPLLIWPFGHRVTIWLLDQCEDVKARRHISYSLKPNTCKENRPFFRPPHRRTKRQLLEQLNLSDWRR
uniref:TRAF-type domain-containing protein n=1 Tax=Macrostomum lignano TaxID=282301 RepID=A0A1I8FGF3_9PLAT